MASAIICLATNQKFNFSRYILLSLVKNIEARVPFYMFPRFVQLLVDHQLGDMSYHQDIYDNPSLTKNVFANMKRVGTGFSEVITPLFENMLVQDAEEVGQAQDDVSIPTEPSTSKPHKKHKSKKQQPKASKVPSPKPSPAHQLPSPSNDLTPDADNDSLTLQDLMDLCTRLSNKVLDLESEVIDINMQDINEEEPAEAEEVLEVVKATKLFTEVVTTAEPTTTTTVAQVPKASAIRRRMGVIIQDPEETSASLIVHTEKIHKKSVTLQELMDLCTRLSNNVLDYKSEVIDIKSSFTDMIQKLEDIVDQLEEENRALKEKYFKTTQVDTAAPVENMEKSFKQGRMIANMDEDVDMQDVDEEEPAEVEEALEVVKAAKLFTEVVTTAEPTTTTAAAQVPKASSKEKKGYEAFARQSDTELNTNINWNDVVEQVKKSERQNNKVMRYQALKRKHLTEAQARNNMMIYLKNMAGFKIDFFKGITYSEIRPIFEKHYNSIQGFLEKEAENFDREDLETLWKLVKERFETTKPKKFLDDFLLNTLKIMFEKPNVEANVWRDQKGRYGLAKQMLDNVRLEVEEESEMSLELLRLVRRQLNEGAAGYSYCCGRRNEKTTLSG
uniref:Synaptobrevin, longin-like domain protein n=1 Tax=Tanacetum cinerariifolium TaxID=118510 RepID=A0A6L2MV90_TANCI|nr:hypothetical protein [Tanacetum cinerariifolium]